MKNIRTMGAWIGAGAILVSLAGCADRNKNGQPDSLATPNEVANAASDMTAKTDNALATAGNSVSNSLATASNSVAKGADEAKDAVSGAGTTGKIKTALGANAALKGSSIDVDTNGDTKTVTLKGTIKSQAQKAVAGAIAKKNAPGYKIVNNLKAG